MNLDTTTDLPTFRRALRNWIGDNAPTGLSQLTDWSRLLRGGGEWWSYPDEMRSDEYVLWDKRVTAERLVCSHWPSQYGGRDMSMEMCRVLDEECLRANVPRVFREQGEAFVGPSILEHGTEEQKQQFLPRIVDGTHKYTQGFSEPNHGSDLAALETRGVVEGDEVVITGQKVWTTAALNGANQIFVLCRTDPAVRPQHRGISYVIVDIAAAGDALTFRPIKQLTGEAEFCETFFDGVRAPLNSVIGGINGGWKAAMTTLENERVGRTSAARNSLMAKDLRELVQEARRTGATHDSEIRRRLVGAHADLKAMERWATPGKPGVHQSVEKLFYSQAEQRFGELALAVLGERAPIRPGADEPGRYRLDRWQRGYLQSLSGTIASGSSEIQLNIIAERVLGLPREPRP